jgi:hypothetical protein
MSGALSSIKHLAAVVETTKLTAEKTHMRALAILWRRSRDMTSHHHTSRTMAPSMRLSFQLELYQPCTLVCNPETSMWERVAGFSNDGLGTMQANLVLQLPAYVGSISN